MGRQRWDALDPRARRLLLSAAAVEGLLKLAALIDLVRRPPGQVHGSKRLWALAITFVNSAGLVPIAYFVRGRRR